MAGLFPTILVAGTLLAPASPPAHGSTFQARLAKLEHAPPQGNSWAHGSVTVGHSVEGRPIDLEEWGSDRSGRRILAFGCIHGTECAASAIPRFQFGCPTTAGIFYVPNLNPDGLAQDTRLNARGVDLNRNFGAGWQPIGTRWDLQYSGPHPFSEPETRLAARLIRAIHPDVTIWFHQQTEPMVRAWGPSVPAARRLAADLRLVRYTELPFRRLPWLAGTAPNWQNHSFGGTASFVVELPPGPLPGSAARTIGGSIAELALPWPRDL